MNKFKNISLNSLDKLTNQLRDKNILTFEDLLFFIQKLPYGRNKNRENLSLVLSEMKGTCSSKHAFIKDIANKNKVKNIELIIGMYKMNKLNTPKIGEVLDNYSLKYLPEAHCYLKIDNETIDVTNEQSDFHLLKDSIIEEQIIEPFQVADYKVQYHKTFIKKWIEINSISFTFDEIWKIREKCISQLSN